MTQKAGTVLTDWSSAWCWAGWYPLPGLPPSLPMSAPPDYQRTTETRKPPDSPLGYRGRHELSSPPMWWLVAGGATLTESQWRDWSGLITRLPCVLIEMRKTRRDSFNWAVNISNWSLVLYPQFSINSFISEQLTSISHSSTTTTSSSSCNVKTTS